jgi:hypothetical protein
LFATKHLIGPAPNRSRIVNRASLAQLRLEGWTKSKILRALVEQEVIPVDLSRRLFELIKYRNALVHGQDMSVNPDAVAQAKTSRKDLEDRLEPSGISRRSRAASRR